MATRDTTPSTSARGFAFRSKKRETQKLESETHNQEVEMVIITLPQHRSNNYTKPQKNLINQPNSQIKQL
jgi:hypothetical protein